MNTVSNDVSPKTPHFEIIDESQVVDHSTGLIWTRSNVPGGRMTQQDAQEACDKLDLGGHSDWRMPTRKELLTLVDDERHSPAIDTESFGTSR